MSTPHLPVEIHDIICSHIAREDLHSYRSASKHLADIGAQYLFRHLTFYASYASLDRIVNIGNRDGLARLVETVIWDTSSISLDVADLDDWKTKILSLRCQELEELRSRWYRQIQNHDACEHRVQRYLWEEYERYKKLVATERDVQTLLLANVTNLLVPFSKLKTIIIEKNEDDHEDEYLDMEVLEPRSTKLVKRGMLHRYLLSRHVPYKPSTDLSPFVAALAAAQKSTHQVEARTLHYKIFSQLEYTQHLQHINVSHITHLHLRFALLDPSSNPQDSSLTMINCKHVLSQGHLRAFLTKFTTLQSLVLDLEARSPGNGRAPVNLQDLFPREQEDGVWPHLKHLAIYHADTPASVITALLSSHASSLRSLALGDVCLDPPASWEPIFTDLQPRLELCSASFSHFLFDARVEGFLRGRSALMGWYCGGGESVEALSSLGPRLAEFMVKGGVCPLSGERKTARVVGRAEDWVGERSACSIT
ncbi:hypothetical protein P171DRAFT_503275 [Karstenula rhodostoma CBS 690.94]|uniref:F-box domain-containing protein n=1 Tax=Karstenula rhodostoma CBS 690.94 TaxID=1392251 RepID=A0A9P4PXJ3_9PLEO|nr:hypothetical protein P171DRAFT_503275 [Karstenula rhodostoma CBS 690.94]